MKLEISPRVIRGILTALLIAIGMLPAVRADAAVPATMSYQGSLKDPGGQPPPDGNHSFVFRLYNVETGGSALWQESQTLSTSGGLFNALLGAVTPLNLPFDAQYWLESVVDGSLLSPRVQLADWFELINRDPRYQLTCVGASAPVYVADEISGNRFRIAGGQPGLKVSWQVTAVRDDAAVQKYQVPVEQDKPGPERGKYLEPSLYGQPATMKIGYVAPKASAR